MGHRNIKLVVSGFYTEATWQRYTTIHYMYTEEEEVTTTDEHVQSLSSAITDIAGYESSENLARAS